MKSKLKEIVRHSFYGGRFADHGIDVDVLPDLLRYKNLVVEVAKELWRRNNPDRQRLPKNVDEAFALKFYSIEPNCATIPLVREITVDDQKSLFELPEQTDELDEAVTLICAAIDAAAEDSAFPERFPKHLLPLFNDYGKTLRDDEWIEQRPLDSDKASRFDSVVRSRLTKWVVDPYLDQVDIVGEVTMARVSKPKMAIEFEGREIEADFPSDDEETITTALRNHTTARLRVVGKGQFDVEGKLQKIVSVDSVTLLLDGERTFEPSTKPVWLTISEISSKIPDEEFDKLPRDGASRLDHYIYGNDKDD